MKQFFIFLFTGASIAILDLIDSAFGNHISLDSICVMSAFTVIYIGALTAYVKQESMLIVLN